jgi:hypothetical protein
MTKIICRQCKKEFSKNTIINGKKRFLGNRKFCIECSPFGLNNRRSINPGVKGTARNSIPYAKLPEKRKNQVRMAVKRLGAKRKTKLIDMFGGKCKICNYSKCERALSFHHRDPKNKKFGLTIPNLSSNSWSKVLEESKKCELYCLNCHAEIEEKISLSDPNCYRHNI